MSVIGRKVKRNLLSRVAVAGPYRMSIHSFHVLLSQATIG